MENKFPSYVNVDKIILWAGLQSGSFINIQDIIYYEFLEFSYLQLGIDNFKLFTLYN